MAARRLRLLLHVAPLLLAAGDPQPRFTCNSVQDTLGDTLTTLLGPNANVDWCSSMDATNNVPGLMQACNAFCGLGNIPLLIGIPTVGFPQSQIDDICLAPSSNFSGFRYDPILMSNCQKWNAAFDALKADAATFVAAASNLTLAQLQFRAGIADGADKLAAVMASQATKDLLMSANDAARLGVFKTQLRSGVVDFLTGGTLIQDLRGAMDAVRNSGRGLKTSLGVNLPQLNSFVEHCRDRLVVVGPDKQYLLDICNQRTANCIQSNDARHVGCCCGSIPLSGSMQISGELPASSQPASSTPTSTGPADVCGLALEKVQPDQARREAQLQASAQGKTLLAQYKASLAAVYGQCRRRLDEEEEGSAEGGGPEPVDAPAAAEAPAPPVAAPSAEPGSEAARRLQLVPLTGCNPRNSTTAPQEKLKTAFWSNTEMGQCDQLPPMPGKKLMDDYGLGSYCRDFCGPNGVPLVIGGISFGFNQRDMDSICVASDLVSTNASQVARCHWLGQQLQLLQMATAQFVASLQVVDAEKVRFQAYGRQIAEALKANIIANAERVLREASVDQQVTAIATLLKNATSELDQSSPGSARADMEAAMRQLEQDGANLQSVLASTAAYLDELTTSCSSLFTGVGPQGEYLLDMCSQTSTKCVEDTSGAHVGCCCGYSPFMALGSAMVPNFTIPGISAATLAGQKARAAPRRRRRLDSPTVQGFDICGEAWKRSRPGVAAGANATRILGGQDLIDAANTQLKARYPFLPQFACDKQQCSTDTGGSCALFSCAPSRGPTDCKSGKCVCKANYCLSGGMCKPAGVASAAPPRWRTAWPLLLPAVLGAAAAHRR